MLGKGLPASMILWSWSLASALHFGPRMVPHWRQNTQAVRRSCGVYCKDESSAVPVLKKESLTSYHAVGGDHPNGIVLIIYTGGTVGMTSDATGALSPDKAYLRQCICEMPEFANSDMPDTDIIEYDPLLDSSNIGVNPGCASQALEAATPRLYPCGNPMANLSMAPGCDAMAQAATSCAQDRASG